VFSVWIPSRRTCLGLTAAWTGIGAGALAVVFACSAYPGTAHNDNFASFWLGVLALMFGAAMIPACPMLLTILLVGGRRYLKRIARARSPWAGLWTATLLVPLALEAVLGIRLIRFLDANVSIATPSWHALEFSATFLAVGGLLALILICSPRAQ
jgi:hypothetical protein